MMTRAIRATAIPLVCLAMLTIGSGRGQPQVPKEELPTPTVKLPEIPDQLGTPRVPVNASVDELIGRMESLRKAKAEIEKQEIAVAAQLKERLKLQAERLSKLGVIAVPPAPVDQGAIFGGLQPKFEAPEKSFTPPAPK